MPCPCYPTPRPASYSYARLALTTVCGPRSCSRRQACRASSSDAMVSPVSCSASNWLGVMMLAWQAGSGLAGPGGVKKKARGGRGTTGGWERSRQAVAAPPPTARARASPPPPPTSPGCTLPRLQAQPSTTLHHPAQPPHLRHNEVAERRRHVGAHVQPAVVAHDWVAHCSVGQGAGAGKHACRHGWKGFRCVFCSAMQRQRQSVAVTRAASRHWRPLQRRSPGCSAR